ncbi:MAG: InlB B-repeat-containing protein [Butyricicoccus porcorum]
MKKRIFSILLCLCMVLMLFPVTALAANEDATALQSLLSGGTVTLDRDYTIDTTLQVGDHVILDLNGHVIKMTGKGSVIQVNSGVSLTLQDSNTTATHTGDYASLPAGGVITGGYTYGNGGGVYVVENGSFTMSGGTIYDCSAEGGGGGVCVSEGSFTMNGGAISGCKASGSGGGVCVSEGSFTMTGGAISGCKASGSGGGVCVKKESSFEMSGGTIYDCTCYNGGVFVSESSFNMTGGTISGCTTDGIGCSCVYVGNGSFTISGGTIDAGNAVSANDKSTINANGGTIYGTVESWGLILNNATDGGCTEFYGKVMNCKNGAISTSGTISGGIYYGGIQDYGGNISGKTVTFMKDGRQYALEVVATDSKVAAPTEPKAPEGMTFAGWYTESTLVNRYKFGKPISDNIILYAGGFEPILTLTVPFTTTVKLGGSAAPGETTFELALIDGSGNELKHDGMYFGAVVTTDGAGDYDGTLTITAPLSWLEDMLSEGAFIWQYDDEEPNWTYDDTVWGLLPSTVAMTLTDDAAPEYTVFIYPTYIKDDGSFAPDLNADPVDRMSFINTYTYSYSASVNDTTTIVIGGGKEESKPVEENPNTGAPVAANMSTLSVLVLASAVAVLKTRKR